MPSLEANFDALVSRVAQGRELGHASDEPIFYFVFPPRQILEVKRSMPAWTARLHNEGWNVSIFSIFECLNQIFGQSKLREVWLAADQKAPLNWERTNRSLANALSGGALKDQLQERLEVLQNTPRMILFVTDLEALHPYTRIGVIEGQLYGKFKVPTVFFYPGEKTGNTSLSFLGFYPEDGNYRSVHIGG